MSSSSSSPTTAAAAGPDQAGPEQDDVRKRVRKVVVDGALWCVAAMSWKKLATCHAMPNHLKDFRIGPLYYLKLVLFDRDITFYPHLVTMAILFGATIYVRRTRTTDLPIRRRRNRWVNLAVMLALVVQSSMNPIMHLWVGPGSANANHNFLLVTVSLVARTILFLTLIKQPIFTWIFGDR